jgi:hypothetical protein
MHRIALAGRNSAPIVSKTVAACLAGVELRYNWLSKVQGFVLGICLARSTVLQEIARTRRGPVRKTEKALSELLRHARLDLVDSSWNCTVKALRKLGLKRFVLYRRKIVMIVDSTTYAKVRSRGKQRRMPAIGQVRLHNVKAKETILAPGYTEFWTGLLLKNKTCLGITRKLYTEHKLDGCSQNALEDVEIRRAIDLIKEAFGVGVIVVADRGFRRRDLLSWLKDELRVDFVIRIEGKLKVKARGWKGLLGDLAPYWPERLQRYWRDSHKEPILSSIRGASVAATLDDGKRLGFNVVHMTPINRKNMDPMLLATTLPIDTRDKLSMIVSLYSKRWTIETFFLTFKQSLGAGKFRVFSCWEAIDRLLAMAHMALLVLHLLYVLAQEATRGAWAKLWKCAQQILTLWDARPAELTLGKFFEALARGFNQRGAVGVQI